MKKHISDYKQADKTVGNSIRSQPWLTSFAIAFLLCLIIGWFMRINALFSNFNAYYGVVQALLGSFVTWVLGGTYAGCQKGTYFLTMFFISALAVIYCVVRNTKTAINVTILPDVINLLRPAKTMIFF